MYEVLFTAEQSKPLWADHVFPVGLHYYAENARELMERHKVATQCSFGKGSSTKKVHLCQLGPRKLKEKKKGKLAQLQNAVTCGQPVKTTACPLAKRRGTPFLP